jgi:hypothetical protein
LKAPGAEHRLPALYLRHLVILWGAAGVGLLIAAFVSDIPFDGSAELQAARALGIVSPTILMGYAKSQDLLEVAALVGLPTLVALVAWLGFWWSRQRALAALPWESEAPSSYSGGRRLSLGLLVLFGGFVSFDLDHFLRPAFNAYVGAWPFLGEEGEMLEWAQRALDGQVFGRDYFCLYGPLMIYALAGSLAVFGESVVVERACTFGLNALGLGVVLFFLYRNLRSHALFVGCALVYLLCFNMLLFPSTNTTLLRVVLGLAPLFVLAGSARAEGPARWAAAGLLSALSLLFSQEAGLCAVVAVAGLAGLDLAAGVGAGAVARRTLAWVGGVVAVLGPFLAYLASQAALGPFLESVYGYPRLMTLGFGALPFPSFRDFLADPLGGYATFEYWILLVYVASLLTVATAFIRGDRSRRVRLLFALTLFGLLLFRAALGRSDAGNVVKASHPAFLLCFLYLDGALSAIRSGPTRFWKGLAAGQLLAWATGLALVLSCAPELRAMIAEATPGLWDPARKLSVGSDGERVPEVARAGVRMDPVTARTLRELKSFLDEATAPGDYVYFFPNEAIYYFLLDRRNPTRFAISYFAITSELRRELVADLERRRPRFVVWSLRTWRVDGILENVQVPEVLPYLFENYRAYRQLEDVQILERVEP